jgi:PPP family 3-phenylpropionic acid transporter
MSYNLFLAIFCIDHGFSSAVPGYAVGVAIVGEVAALALAPRLFARRGAGGVVAWSLLLSIVRWIATAMAVSAWWLVLLQLLHFAGFGLWYAGLLRELDHYAEQTPRPLLQSVFASVVLGCGGLAAGLLGGRLVGAEGSSWAFWLAAVADVCALGIWLMRGRYFARPSVAATA